MGPIYRAVIAEAQSDEVLRETIHARFLVTVEQRTLDRIRLAQKHGQLRGDLDLQYPAEILAGALYYRWLLTMRPVDENIIDGLIGMFIDAYGVSAPSTETGFRFSAQTESVEGVDLGTFHSMWE